LADAHRPETGGDDGLGEGRGCIDARTQGECKRTKGRNLHSI